MSKVNSVLVPSGKFITVTFVTNDGTLRKLNGRTGVRKYIKNGTQKTQATLSNYFLVYTREGSKYFDSPKMINKQNIIIIKAQGISVMKNKNSQYAQSV
jgi:hypothetical protein